MLGCQELRMRRVPGGIEAAEGWRRTNRLLPHPISHWSYCLSAPPSPPQDQLHLALGIHVLAEALDPAARPASPATQRRAYARRPGPLPWENSILLREPVQQVPGLKREKDLVIIGSSALIQSLSLAGLMDEYLLMITPLVLGQARQLFPRGFRTPS